MPLRQRNERLPPPPPTPGVKNILRPAALRCAEMDGGPDDPSWNELAATIGVEVRAPEVGDEVGCPMLTVALYWPKTEPK